MSDLVYQNYNNKCQGWTNPSSSLFFGPQISSLSGYYSPAGSTTLISISGTNFLSYSVVAFGIYNPTVYFINSNTLQFYVPSTLNSGTFPVTVFNGSIPSNTVTYTIDNASGYWLLNSNGSISNTNSGTTAISALSRGAPVTIIGAYTVPSNVNWIICDTTTEFVSITLPLTTQNIGREIMLKNLSTNIVQSYPPNIIVPINSTDLTTTILPAISGSWATIVYDGTNWITMQANFVPPP
jgi:hypothetical protein